MSDTESDDLGGIRNDGDEIVRNDSQVVAVKGEVLNGLSTGVDQSKSVNLSWGESEVGDASAVAALGLIR